MSQVFGVKIILDDRANPYAQDISIGLYNVTGANSELRWIQNAITGVTDWKYGMIVKNGLKPFSVEIDLRRGGNVELPGRGGVTVTNTAQFWKTIQDLRIDLTSCVAEIHLFNGSTPTKFRTYMCERPQWNAREYTIPFKGVQELRRVDILKSITVGDYPNAKSSVIGKKIPAVFGKLFPTINSIDEFTRNLIAKFIRTAANVAEDYSDDTFTNSGETDIKLFPIIAVPGTAQVNIEATTTVPAISLTPSDLYMIIVDGDGEGQIRQVSSMTATGTTSEISVSVGTVFETTPSAVDDDTRSWVKFLTITRGYTADFWPCKNFLDNDGIAVLTPELYSWDDTNGLYDGVSNAQFSVTDTDDNNGLTLTGQQGSGDIDTVDSFKIIPMADVYMDDSATIDYEYGTGGSGVLTYTRLIDGVFYNYGPGVPDYTGGTVDNIAYSHDKLKDTYAELTMSIDARDPGNTIKILRSVKCTLPPLPQNIAIDAVYVGIKAVINPENNIINPEIRCQFNRFAYTKDNDDTLVDLDEDVNPPGNTHNVDDFPDYYWEDDPAPSTTGNSNFYIVGDSVTSQVQYITGYTTFEIAGCAGDTARDVYNLYKDMNIYIYGDGDITELDIGFKLYEVAIILKLGESSIADEIYSPLAGRVYDDGFEGRKTSTDLIEGPINVYEHLCRLQCWKETGVAPTLAWGLEYANAPQIKTSGEGSFDAAGLPSQTFGAQIQDDGYSDELKRSITKNFFLISYNDTYGKECVKKLNKNVSDPVYTVTLSDITDREFIELIECDEDAIYPEPFVNYAINTATGEPEKQIRVTNAGALSYSSDYVQGLTGANAQALWQTCHSLSLKSRALNAPPSDLTDMVWANGENDDEIARNYILDWAAWQGNREINLPLHANTCMSWLPSTRINVELPQQTNSQSLQAIVERVEIDPNPPYRASVKAIFIE